MGRRVGFDLMSAEAVRDAIDVHGRRYLERVYSERELAECRSGDGFDARGLASRFAAKEATMKAIELRDDPVSWRDLEVCRTGGDRPELTLSGGAAVVADRAGVTGLALSLTHAGSHAAAVVIAEINGAC
jgi:holo-[acyl-carrier protein] synthase